MSNTNWIESLEEDICGNFVSQKITKVVNSYLQFLNEIISEITTSNDGNDINDRKFMEVGNELLDF